MPRKRQVDNFSAGYPVCQETVAMTLLQIPIGLSKVAARTVIVLALSILPVMAQEASPATYRLYVDGLACPFCAYGLEKNLATIPGIEAIETDIETGAITVTMAGAAELQHQTATRAVEDAGFALRDFERIATAGQVPAQE